MTMATDAPFAFRIGDRLRLRKRHPCGGWTWRVSRIGADIGLLCESCGRRVMLERTQLERDMKAVLERGVEAPATSTETAAASADRLRIPEIGTVLKPCRLLQVRIACYLTSTAEMASGRLSESDLVRVVAVPTSESRQVSLEPVESDRFERTFIPGGIRSQESYQGFAILIDLPVLAREFAEVDGQPAASE